ncbi:diguanylate cyclase [Lysobacter sp. TY2-98]|uniref:sensor domain-containing protein n=1 Tax=Lysobacter sp. TY2-98 TaxID=2290922 RepID=UPI000E1FF779|nr:diguanylate cyclase [Lysobacter sp. TY2-98]AXK72758.1 diguanylate cyclase [Lysobacter sp. TY2-98]
MNSLLLDRPLDAIAFEATFADAPFGMGCVDACARWLHANTALRAMFGVDTLPSLRALAGPQQAAALDDLLDGRRARLRLEPELGAHRPVLDLSPLREADGRVVGFIVHGEDRAAQTHATSERDAFFALTPDLLAFVDARDRLLEVNPAWEATLGWSPRDLEGHRLDEFVHEDDRERVLAQFAEVRNGTVVDASFRGRLRSRYGGYRWIEWQVREFDVARLYCTARDVTDQVRARDSLLRNRDELERRIAQRTHELDRALARLQLHADNSPLATIEWDRQLNVAQWSHRAREMFGWHEDEIVGHAPSVLPMLHPDDVAGVDAAMARLASRETSRHVHTVRMVARDGRVRVCEWFDSALFDANGRVSSILSLVQDVTEREAAVAALQRAHEDLEAKVAERTLELERLMAMLESQARQDPLTDLPNRRGLMERLPRSLDRSTRHDGAIAVMFVDLDRFKHVNDTLGHDAGDELLRECARRLVSAVRKTDIVARLGGDEFVIVLENVRDPETHARRVAEKVREALAEPVDVGTAKVRVSASIGVVIQADGTITAEDLISRADRRMYAAKHAGGNAVRTDDGAI